MKKIYFLRSLTLLLFFTILLPSTNVFSQDMVYNIDDPEELRDVIYKPGDVIILKNGTYTTDERMIFLGSGTAEKPVTFRAETPGGVIFTGGPRLTIGGESDGSDLATGEYLVVDGLHWKGGYGASNFIEFRNGQDFAHHSTIQNCAIDGLTADPDDLADDLAKEQITKHRWIVLYGTYNSVINCSFMNKNTAGAIVLGEYSYNAFPPVPDGEPEVNESCLEVGHTIANNYFYNFEKLPELYGKKADGSDLSNAGDSETIRLGTSSYQMVNSNAMVTNNYFVQSDGENEIITNKSKGNSYINNTFRRSRGSLVMRHGSFATVEGNYFLGEDVDGTGGIRISDSEHSITNNYIQDCVTVEDYAKWNNGITFIGGGDDEDVPCTSDDVSNGYQKSLNIDVSNNTIVNTNAPLFYNDDKDNDNNITGEVKNNLIYFADGDANLTDVISGDTDTSFDNIGKSLDYSGNVYRGTVLGETDLDTDNGFSLETGITATADGEIFTFSGAGSTDKGANMGSYEPTTDDMVGYGIGACFLDFSGANITDGDCTIEIIESLSVSGLSTLGYEASDNDVTVTANVSWTAESNNDWITIDGSDTTSGSGSATVSVSVTENVDLNSRVGTVTFTGAGTDGDIVKTLTVTQDGGPRTNLINTGEVDDPVTIHSYSSYQTSKDAFPVNTLDKDDGSIWTAEDGAVLDGDYKGDGEFVIYDLGSEYELDFIQLKTNNKSDAYGLQIWVSTTGVADGDFSMILPTTGDLLLTATSSTDFNKYEVLADARYVKLIGFGRFNEAGDTRESVWTNIAEIEFFGDANALSTDDYEFNKNISVYPVPAKDNLNIKILNDRGINALKLFSIDGKLMMEKELNSSQLEFSINIESLSNGTYILNVLGDSGLNVSKMIIVSE